MQHNKRMGSFLVIMALLPFALSGCGISKPDRAKGTDIVESTAGGGEEQLPDSADNAECTAGGGEEQLLDSADYAEYIPSDDGGQDEEALSAEILWEEAAVLIAERNYPQAILTLSKIEEDERAEKILQQLRYLISGEYIVNLDFGIAAIDREGKVVICADTDNYGEIGYTEVQSWTDIVKLSRAFLSLDALSRDGHFFTTLKGEEYKTRNERCWFLSGG